MFSNLHFSGTFRDIRLQVPATTHEGSPFHRVPKGLTRPQLEVLCQKVSALAGADVEIQYFENQDSVMINSSRMQYFYDRPEKETTKPSPNLNATVTLTGQKPPITDKADNLFLNLMIELGGFNGIFHHQPIPGVNSAGFKPTRDRDYRPATIIKLLKKKFSAPNCST